MKDRNPLAAVKQQGFVVLPDIFPPIHFDESTPDNGLPSILPGTHDRGILSDERDSPIERDRLCRRVRGPQRWCCRHASSCGACFLEIRKPDTWSRPSYRVRCLGIDCQSPAAGDGRDLI